MRARFGDARELVSAVYGTQERSALLASFVPDVFAAAESGDGVAAAILDDAAAALAATLRAAAEGITGPLSAVGGLVTPGSPIHARLTEEVDLRAPAGSAAHGAAILARQVRSRQLSPLIAAQLDVYTEGD
jgi:N-acetylglucosamine kinase-like BadF-type ATPase